MALTDVNGRAYKRKSETKPGDRIMVDEGFNCIRARSIRVIEHDDDGFWIKCKSGRHYLDGQEDHRDGTDAYIGIYPYA